MTTRAQIESAIFTALSALQAPTSGPTAARPFALVSRWCGQVSAQSGLITEAVAQFPCAFLRWDRGQSQSDVLTLVGDAEDQVREQFTVLVCVEDPRDPDALFVGASGVPGALTLMDNVETTINGLVIAGTLRNTRLRYIDAAPYYAQVGVMYVAAMVFVAERAAATVAPTDTTVALTKLHGDVNLVETYSSHDPENPVDEFEATP